MTAPENETNPTGPDSAAGSTPTPHTTAALGRVVPADYDELPPGAIDPSDRAAVEALPPHSALLIVQHGPNAGARFLLDAPRVTAGRDPAADIFLDDVTVSRKHAEFTGEAGQFTVRDVGSLNGTYVNRSRIDEGTLQAGDEVQIGKFRLTFHPSPRRGEDAAAPAPSAEQ
ncbi:MAG TPA: FHA domain-containing protein [Ruania sp.]|nr:FHA domain-containing protein [Ruania sp.]